MYIYICIHVHKRIGIRIYTQTFPGTIGPFVTQTPYEDEKPILNNNYTTQ